MAASKVGSPHLILSLLLIVPTNLDELLITDQTTLQLCAKIVRVFSNRMVYRDPKGNIRALVFR